MPRNEPLKKDIAPQALDVDRAEPWPKLKALMQKAAEQSVDGLWAAIGRFVDLFAPDERGNHFAAAGYCNVIGCHSSIRSSNKQARGWLLY
jgi:hypothetical protein